jgi:hypothetical protein
MAEKPLTNSSPSPIFVVGAPRSGTTLLRSMLDAHPNICCPTWETGVFEKFAMVVNGDFTERRTDIPNLPIERDDLLAWCRQSADDLMSRLISASGKPRWAEKTPAHVFCIDLIHEIYPNAQFIHIVRNGRDVVRSLQSMPWAPREIRWSCHRWVASVAAGRDAGRRLPKELYTEVRYEDLTREPESTIRQLCDYLGEPFEPRMLAFHDPANNSWGVASEPIKPRPVNKHRDLSLMERVVFAHMSKATMHELGYH